jgi:hypothetical protein
MKKPSTKSEPTAIKLLPFHPIANEFPLLEGKDFDDLVKDIDANGQRQGQDIDIWQDKIIDGRNRARACQKLGIKPRYRKCRFKDEAAARAYVLSQNIHRRHLTAEQKRDIIAKFADWSKSDRVIGKEFKVDHKTAGKARKAATAGEASPVQKRTGKDGKKRKAPTPKKNTGAPDDGAEPAAPVEEMPAVATDTEAAPTTSASGGELAQELLRWLHDVQQEKKPLAANIRAALCDLRILIGEVLSIDDQLAGNGTS